MVLALFLSEPGGLFIDTILVSVPRSKKYI